MAVKHPRDWGQEELDACRKGMALGHINAQRRDIRTVPTGCLMDEELHIIMSRGSIRGSRPSGT